MRTLALLGMFLAGCPADPVDRIPDTGDDTGDSGDTTDTVPPILPTGDRILLFHGHGGPEEDESGWARFDLIDQHWKDVYGWNSDYRSYIPDDVSDYRAIFLIGPGYTGEEAFTGEELALMQGALAVGTRIVVLTEKDGCATTTPNDLLAGLGSTLRLTGSGLGDYQIAEMDLISPHQITAGVEILRFRDACYLDVGDGEYLARFQDEHMVAVERIDNGGDVVLIGDFEFMDDSGPWEWAHNATLADRLVEVDPAYATEAR